MKLKDQRNAMWNTIVEAIFEIDCLRAAVHRKTSMPYGDGTYSNMVNVNSDVLPRLDEIKDKLVNGLLRAEQPLSGPERFVPVT